MSRSASHSDGTGEPCWYIINSCTCLSIDTVLAVLSYWEVGFAQKCSNPRVAQCCDTVASNSYTASLFFIRRVDFINFAELLHQTIFDSFVTAPASEKDKKKRITPIDNFPDWH